MLEISIYGGTAMMLAYDSRNATKDIDAIFHPVEEGQGLIDQVAKLCYQQSVLSHNDVHVFNILVHKQD